MAPNQESKFDDNVILLYHCLNNAIGNGGKLEWTHVAEVLGIQKNTAQKRLERLRKAVQQQLPSSTDTSVAKSKADSSQALGSNDENASSPPAKKQKKSAGKAKTAAIQGRKRKLEEVEHESPTVQVKVEKEDFGGDSQ